MKLAVAFLLLVTVLGTRTLQRPTLLNGVRLKAIAGKLDIAFSAKQDSTGKIIEYGGATYRLLDWLSQRLNFTYEIITQTTFDFGRLLPNGSCTGMMGYIQRKESDVALSAFGFVHLVPFVERSFPWEYVDFSILIPFPEELSKTWAAFLPFQLHVWIAFLLSVTFTALSLMGLDYLKKSRTSGHIPPGSIVMYLLGVTTAQGGYLAYKGRRIIIIASAWCLLAFVLVTAYSGLLTSFLSTTRLLPFVDSLSQLAEKMPNVNLFVFRGSYPDIAFVEAFSGDLNVFGEYFRTNEDKRTPTPEHCLDSAVRTGGLCIVATPLVDGYLKKLAEQTNDCRMSRSKEPFFQMPVYLYFHRESPYHRVLNKEIIWAADTGLLKKWSKEAYKPSGKCQERTTAAPKNSPLRFKDLMSAFVLLGIGSSLSLITFVIEATHYRIKARNVLGK